jgi:hypothetical protein
MITCQIDDLCDSYFFFDTIAKRADLLPFNNLMRLPIPYIKDNKTLKGDGVLTMAAHLIYLLFRRGFLSGVPLALAESFKK